METIKKRGKASYLCARDPSILSWNVSNMNKTRCNLKNLMKEDALLEPEKQNKPHQIDVYLRIKNCTNPGFYKHEDNILTCNVPQTQTSNSKQHLREGDLLRKKYTFSHIFPEDCTQSELFNAVVKARVLDFINGNNNTLLTYGSSGSGKTYTIVGTAAEPGIIPRTLEYIFRTLPKQPSSPKCKLHHDGQSVSWLTSIQGKDETCLLDELINDPNNLNERQQEIRTYKAMQQRLSNEPVANLDNSEDITTGIWISFAEIYNEQIYDLLECKEGKSRQKLKLCNNNGNTFIVNLKQVYVSQGVQAYELLQFGLRNLKYAATSINSHSSRSHCIFIIKLLQASEWDNTIRVSTFSLCDLAGSERSKKTNNIGTRLKESNNINNSLLVLGRCISSVRDSQNNKRVPFRESKLTQLFQKALSGKEEISLVVNINPIRDMVEETIHALNFSAIAKDIVIVRPEITKIDIKSYEITVSNEGDSKLVSTLKTTIEELYLALEAEKLQSIQTDQETRDHMVSEFKIIIEDIQGQWKEKLNLKDKRIRELELQLRQLQSETDEDTSIICLDDSSDGSLDGSSDNSSDDSSDEELANTSISRLEQVVTDNAFDAKAFQNLVKENSSLRKSLHDTQMHYEEELCAKSEKLIMLQEELDAVTDMCSNEDTEDE